MLGFCLKQSHRFSVECPPRKSTTDAFDLASALLSQQPRPTGVLILCDLLAIAVLQAAARLGLRVPDDVSVIDCDGIPLAAQIRPTLTTIQQPLVEKGVVAAELLLSDRENTPSKILDIATDWMVRTRFFLEAARSAASRKNLA